MFKKAPKSALSRFFSRDKGQEPTPATPSQKTKAQKAEKENTFPKVEDRDIGEEELLMGLLYVEEEGKPGVLRHISINQGARDTHFYIVGGSGTGKTKFLEHLILQDIKADRGVGIIDPHGDLAEEIRCSMPFISGGKEKIKEKSKNIIFIDPSDPEQTVTFNPLEKIGTMETGKLVDELMDVFEKIWGEFWGPRTANIMRNSLIALSDAELTLAEIPLLLTDQAFREDIMTKTESQTCKDFFLRDFASVNPRTRREWIEPTLNKVYAFLSRDEARHMLSAQKSSFNLRDIMDNKKILIAKLDKGQLGQVSSLLGSLLMSKIQSAAFSRTDLDQEKRTPFYLYIDEFQNFASKSFVDILSEARKYGLSLTMAHQGLSQLPRDLRSSILTNCSTHAYFKVSREDAEVLAKEGFKTTGYAIKSVITSTGGFTPIYFTLQEEWENYIRDLQYIPKRCFVAILKDKGEGIHLESYPTPAPWEWGDTLLRESQTDREKVRKWIEEDRKKVRRWTEELEIGKKYLRSRKAIEKECRERREKFTALQEPKNFREPEKSDD